MASLRRHESKKQRTAKAAKKAAKGAKKTAKGTAVQVSKRAPLGKRLPIVIGAAVAALVAIKLVTGRGGDPQTA